MTVPMMGWGQALPRPIAATNHPVVTVVASASSSRDHNDGDARRDLARCGVYRVTSLPGSHQFASDFIEAIASDPSPRSKDRGVMWGLTADLSSAIPFRNRAMYISKSSDGGATWRQVARIDQRYFDAGIGEGLRNGFIVAPGGSYFVITTQRGAFQVFPGRNAAEALVKPIVGPRVPYTPPKKTIAKKPGEPIRANGVQMTEDGRHLIVGYGYFDLEPKIFRYHKGKHGSWIEDGPLPRIPTEMDILSMEFADPKKRDPSYLYVGTGDQAYLLDLHRLTWSRVDGVGEDSAIHGMSVVGGLHLAACWGVYNPISLDTVKRVTKASFLLYRGMDQSGANVRAYSIAVDPLRRNREAITSHTGVYTSEDSGQTWRRVNDLPEEEFRSAHFNSDGTLMVSGIAGTYLVNPYSDACFPRFAIRGQ